MFQSGGCFGTVMNPSVAISPAPVKKRHFRSRLRCKRRGGFMHDMHRRKIKPNLPFYTQLIPCIPNKSTLGPTWLLLCIALPTALLIRCQNPTPKPLVQLPHNLAKLAMICKIRGLFVILEGDLICQHLLEHEPQWEKRPITWYLASQHKIPFSKIVFHSRN